MKKRIDYSYGKFNNIDTFVFDRCLEELLPNYITEVKLSFTYLDDEGLLEINKKFLNHDYYTDIITFDYSKKNRLIGDIFISVERVEENANDLSKSNELLRVMSHGVLHLLGYKDSNEEEKKEMRLMEDKWLNFIVSRES
ncbi:MAG: rRNA maturation RNase YbeY [Schleiferiaceae bacterium]|nr:rRNA maturation RNase YbeY [Schleiferiaceae bacterium]